MTAPVAPATALPHGGSGAALLEAIRSEGLSVSRSRQLVERQSRA